MLHLPVTEKTHSTDCLLDNCIVYWTASMHQFKSLPFFSQEIQLGETNSDFLPKMRVRSLTSSSYSGVRAPNFKLSGAESKTRQTWK